MRLRRHFSNWRESTENQSGERVITHRQLIFQRFLFAFSHFFSFSHEENFFCDQNDKTYGHRDGHHHLGSGLRE